MTWIAGACGRTGRRTRSWASVTAGRLSRSSTKRRNRVSRLIGCRIASQINAAMIDCLDPVSDLAPSVTADSGREFAGHADVPGALGAHCCFVRGYHSWEWGLTGHTNRPVRDRIPKSTDFRKAGFGGYGTPLPTVPAACWVSGNPRTVRRCAGSGGFLVGSRLTRSGWRNGVRRGREGTVCRLFSLLRKCPLRSPYNICYRLILTERRSPTLCDAFWSSTGVNKLGSSSQSYNRPDENSPRSRIGVADHTGRFTFRIRARNETSIFPEGMALPFPYPACRVPSGA